jgi:lipopolysaccharide/colanic/teichoic acid biosynthesis glycosyltransferase
MVRIKLGSPIFFKQPRPGLNGKIFNIYKFRTMTNECDQNGILLADSYRLTKFGQFLRSSSLDELPGLLNVINGNMSLVGPRPNVDREVFLYTSEEKKLLIIRPGITDLASIIFSDLANILEANVDPNICYNQLVRPWKSRFGLIYVNQGTTKMYLKIVWYTAVNIIKYTQCTETTKSILMTPMASTHSAGCERLSYAEISEEVVLIFYLTPTTCVFSKLYNFFLIDRYGT